MTVEEAYEIGAQSLVTTWNKFRLSEETVHEMIASGWGDKLVFEALFRMGRVGQGKGE